MSCTDPFGLERACASFAVPLLAGTLSSLGCRGRLACTETASRSDDFFRLGGAQWNDDMRLDPAENHSNLKRTPWLRWALLGALLLIGIGYIVVFCFFLSHSTNFLEERINHKASDFSRSHPLQLPATLSFGAGSLDNSHLGSGWHRPEEGGVWSSSTDTRLEIKVAPPKTKLALRVTAGVLVAERAPRMRVELLVNHSRVGEWIRDQSNAFEPFVASIPAAMANKGQLLIQFKVDHVVSPFRLKTGPDARELGLKLQRLELRDSDSSPRSDEPSSIH